MKHKKTFKTKTQLKKELFVAQKYMDFVLDMEKYIKKGKFKFEESQSHLGKTMLVKSDDKKTSMALKIGFGEMTNNDII